MPSTQSAQIADAERQIQEISRRIGELEESRDARHRDMMAAKVELARGEQHLDHLQNQLKQFSQDREERQRALADSREQLANP